MKITKAQRKNTVDQIDTYDMDSYEELYFDLNRKANNPITHLFATIVLITLVVFRRKILSN